MGHDFDIYMLGIITGLVIIIALNWLVDWYWSRDKNKETNQDHLPIEARGGESFSYKSSIIIRLTPKKETLEDQLKKALEAENYEVAAKLRDKIKNKK